MRNSLNETDIKKIADRIYSDPAFFSFIAFDVWLWSKQREIVESLLKYDKIAVYSATGTGKSFLQAILTIWYLQTRRNNLISLLSPNYRQLLRSVWRNVIDMYHRSRIKLLGEPTATIWKIPERNAQAEPLSYRKIEAIQGLHEEHMLFLLEESSGLDEVVWDAVYGNMTGGKEVKLIAFGNPLYPKGEYYKTLFDPTFHKIRISIFDTPNFTGEIDEIPEPYRTKIRNTLPNEKYVESVRIKYGENSAYWKAKVLGMFPEQSDLGLFSISDIEDCMKMPDLEEDYPVCFTIDVAREGVHATVIAIWEGMNLRELKEIRKRNFPELANYIMHLIREYNPEWITLDTSGMGIGLYDILLERGISNVVSVQFHSPAYEDDKYGNVRTEMYFNLADAVKNKKVKLLDLEELKQELLAQEFAYDSIGRYVMLDKQKIKNKLGRSPDFSDAIALRFYINAPRVSIY